MVIEDRKETIINNQDEEQTDPKDDVIVGLITVAGFLLGLLFVNHKKHEVEKKEILKENKKLKSVFNAKNELRKLEDLVNNSNLDIIVKTRFKELIDNYEDIDPQIELELKKSMELIENRHLDTALLSLVKIIENQLIALFANNINFITWCKEKKYKYKTFDVHLKFSLDSQLIDKDEFKHLEALKESRNIEVHQVGKQKDPNFLLSSIIMSFHFIQKIGKEINKLKVEIEK